MTLPKDGDAALRRAHYRLREEGVLPSPQSVGALLANSWRRSQAAGLAPSGRLQEALHLNSFQLARAAERQQELIAHARPVMEFVFAQTRESGSVLILADDHGVILQALGDTGFLARAERVALMPGASWNERHRGTNAIGTALAEGKPVAVHGPEHFLARNGFLTCAAVPVMAPDGRILGALDISGDHRDRHPHTFGLVRAAAQMVENRLFEARYGGSLRIRFHSLAEGIGSISEGVVAISEEGWILGANQTGLALLGLAAADLGITPLSRVLRLRIDELMDSSRRAPGEPILAERLDGTRLFLRVDPGHKAPSAGLSRPARPRDALAALDTGDERLATAIDRARRVLDKPINVLLQGESGVGKEYFAKAMHESSARAKGPFVFFNCADVAVDRIETELFGSAEAGGSPGCIAEAQGGTLFVAEVGELPPVVQARLLRLLHDRRLTPPGGGAPQAMDCTLICATQRNLTAAIERGVFSVDLYYRLNGLLLQLPPLRERHDFPALLARLLREVEPQLGVGLDPALAAAFADYRWPGNLRQMTNALRAACALIEPGQARIGWKHLPDDLAEALREPQARHDEAGLATDNLSELSAAALARAIKASHGNMSEAARRLGISRNTLYRHLRNGSVPRPE
ncbi:MAG: sigma-54-dependent Fis family transcriptional regulator [Rhodocyclales bacterium]|nr:sigma-54-dependent Fis family transcriptional regulator [Rhodocyclales bacterium]